MIDKHTEVEYEWIDAPDCFGYVDVADRNCQRCQVLEDCVEEQAESRPPCFGLWWDEDDVECSNCVDESYCAQKSSITSVQGEQKMAKARVRRRRAVAKKPPVPRPEVVEEEVAEEPEPEPVVRKRKPSKRTVRRALKPKPEPEPEDEEEDYSSWKLVQLRVELKDRDMASDGRKAELIERLLADDAGEYEEEEPEPEPVVRKRKPSKRTVRRALKPKPEPEPEDDEPVAGTVEDILEAMQTGQALLISRLDDDQWQFTLADAVGVTAAKGRGLRGEAFWREVCTEDYYTFYYADAGSGTAWEKMTHDERVEFAEDLGVDWDEHEDERITKLSMFKAIVTELDIEKYKPEYKSNAARRALR